MPDSPYYTRRTPRRWAHDGFFPFRLEVLTPVFISSGEDLSPLDYVIRKEDGGHVLHLVDAESWLLTAQELDDVRVALNKGDMLRLRQLMDEHLDAALYSQACVPFSSETTATNLLSRIRNSSSLSNAEVQPFTRNPVTKAAFVPGSSLKGALSTPLIDSLDHGELKAATHSTDKRAYSRQLEKMFGNIKEHAMQALKISDIPVAPQSTRIVAAVEVRRESGKPGTPKTPCEVLPPASAKSLPLYGRLFMDTKGGLPHITLPDGTSLSFAKLSALNYSFYTRRFRDELSKFYQLSHLASVKQALQPVLQRIERINPEKEILLRVGHYSHIECVTVSSNAPRARKGFGKTRTLAERTLPFGWVILSICEEEEYRRGLEQIEVSIASAMKKNEAHRTTRETELGRACEEQRKLLEAAEKARISAEEVRLRREREAAKREEELAALSPAERAIAEVAAPGSTEAQSMALFAQLESMDKELKMKAAHVLSKCWQRLNKWDGKLSKKQAAKVAIVKQILEG